MDLVWFSPADKVFHTFPSADNGVFAPSANLFSAPPPPLQPSTCIVSSQSSSQRWPVTQCKKVLNKASNVSTGEPAQEQVPLPTWDHYLKVRKKFVILNFTWNTNLSRDIKWINWKVHVLLSDISVSANYKYHYQRWKCGLQRFHQEVKQRLDERCFWKLMWQPRNSWRPGWWLGGRLDGQGGRCFWKPCLGRQQEAAEWGEEEGGECNQTVSWEQFRILGSESLFPVGSYQERKVRATTTKFPLTLIWQ